MAKIVVDGVAQEMPDNAPILDTCEDLDVPFGCQQGECGTCVVTVLEGMENLEPKNDKEKAMGLRDDQRLACQAVVKSGTVKLTY